jgi:hypothetical protein
MCKAPILHKVQIKLYHISQKSGPSYKILVLDIEYRFHLNVNIFDQYIFNKI